MRSPRPLRPAPLVGALALATSLAACDAPAPTTQAPSGPRPAREAWNVDLALAEDGVRRARLQAPYLAAFEGDSTYARLAGDSTAPLVVVTLFGAAGDTTATVTAPEVVYREAERRFEALGPVVVEARGRRLDAQRLVWNDATKRLDAPGPVTVLSPTEHIQGRNLSANEDLSRYTLGQVTASVLVDKP